MKRSLKEYQGRKKNFSEYRKSKDKLPASKKVEREFTGNPIKLEKKGICSECGNQIPNTGRRGCRLKTCSDECREIRTLRIAQEWRDKHLEKAQVHGHICEMCGKEFMRHHKNTKYCDLCKVAKMKEYQKAYQQRRAKGVRKLKGVGVRV